MKYFTSPKIEKPQGLKTVFSVVVSILLAILIKKIMPDFTGQPSYGIYSVIPAFTYRTVVGNSDKYSDYTGWGTDRFLSFEVQCQIDLCQQQYWRLLQTP